MSASIMYTQVPSQQAPSRPRAFSNDSEQYVHYLGNILHSEPIVERCLEAITSNTLIKVTRRPVSERASLDSHLTHACARAVIAAAGYHMYDRRRVRNGHAQLPHFH